MDDARRHNVALYALVAEGFLMRLGFGIISFTLPLYARHLGLNLTEVGALLAVTSVVKVALKPLTGWVADHVGVKRGLVAALALRSLVSFLLAFTASPWQLFSIRTIHGVSTSVRDPAVNALIAENADEKAMGSAFAWYFTAKSLAGSLGKAIAGVLLVLTAANYPAVFLVTWGISSLTLPAVIFVVPAARGRQELLQEEETAAAADPQRPAGAAEAQHSVYSRVAAVAGLGFMISITASMIDRFYPILATEYAGMSTAQAGIVYLASAVFMMVVGPLFGWLSDRYGRRPTTAVRTIANASSSLLYLLVPTPVGFTTGKLLDDGGRAGFRPAWGALKADISSVRKSRRAQMMGLMDVGDDAGDMVGPFGGGLLWDVWGAAGLLVTRIALACLTEVYAATVFWRRPKEPVAATGPPPFRRRQAQAALSPTRCWFCRRRPCGVRAVDTGSLDGTWTWQVQPVCSRCERLLKDAGQQRVRSLTEKRPGNGTQPRFAETPSQQALPPAAASYLTEVPAPTREAKWRDANGGSKRSASGSGTPSHS